MIGSSRVSVFIVQIWVAGELRVYKESRSAAGARAMAKSLSQNGYRASVRRFDIEAKELACPTPASRQNRACINIILPPESAA